MDLVVSINSAINGFVWGPVMMVLLIGTGILMTVRMGGMQFRRFGHAMKNTLGKIFTKQEAAEGEMTPFQAVSTALAGTVGTGNIAGITAAVTLGGPGALFWLWITALIGMATKYSEILLAVKFRERNALGDWVGGPMYTITKGLGTKWKWLAVLFSIFAALAALGTGNAIQSGNIVSSIDTVILAFNPDFGSFATVNLIIGLILAVAAAFVLFGGVKRLGSVTEKLVPGMAVIYIVACLAVIVFSAPALPAIFRDIFVGAFSPAGVTGGAVGSMFVVISWGMKRGIFSSEAGLGTAPMAHATSSETVPAKQALYGVFEVFLDTIVICTLTGLTLLCGAYHGGVDLHIGTMGETNLVAYSLGTLFTEKGGSLIIALLGEQGAQGVCHQVGLREGRLPDHRHRSGTVRILHHPGLGSVRLPLLRVRLRHQGHQALLHHLHHLHRPGRNRGPGRHLGHLRHPERLHGHPQPDRRCSAVRRRGQGDQRVLQEGRRREGYRKEVIKYYDFKCGTHLRSAFFLWQGRGKKFLVSY